jgi:tetratricopeptide (TPR) repeat protein
MAARRVTGPPRGDRKVIPRWRSFRVSMALGELLPLSSERGERPWASRTDGLGRLREDFCASEIGPVASDLMGAALVLGQRESARDVAERVIGRQIPATAAARIVAERLLEAGDGAPPELTAREIVDLDEDARRDELRELRRLQRQSPYNALRWTDLARLQTVLGKDRNAKRAMLAAQGLAPEDRHVLRSAARLAIHFHRPDEARAILLRAPRTRHDPWLLACEISAADIAGERSGLLRTARQLLADGRFSDHELSELASAVATIELGAGDLRASRQLFRQALRAPSDNSIAQVTWASPALGLRYDEQALAAPASWEARAIAAHRGGDWRQATQEAQHWLVDQPFASRPAELGSYEASKGGDFEMGLKLAEQAIHANPKEFLLRNNAAFCLLSMNKVKQAKTHLDVIEENKLAANERATLTATWGLYHYRSGEHERGRKYYLRAIRESRDSTSRALASIMLAREELLAGMPGTTETLASAMKLGEQNQPEFGAWLAQLTPPPAQPVMLPKQPGSQLSPETPIPHSSLASPAAVPTLRLPAGERRSPE